LDAFNESNTIKSGLKTQFLKKYSQPITLHTFSPRLELNYLLFSIKQVPFKNTLTHYVISASPAEVALGPFKHDSAPEDRESHQPVN